MKHDALLLFRFLKKTLRDQKKLVIGLFISLLGMGFSQAAFLFGTKGFMKALFDYGGVGIIKLRDLLPLEKIAPKALDPEGFFGKSLEKIYHYEFSSGYLVIALPLYFLLAGVLQAGSHYSYQLCQQLLSLRVASSYRDRLFSAILQLPYLTQKTRSPAQWMSLVMNDVIYLQMRLTDLTTAVLKDSTLVVVSFFSLWVIHWPTALALSVMIPVMAWGMGRAGRKVSVYAEGFQKRLGRIASMVHDWRQRFEFIISQKGQKKEYERFQDLTQDYFDLMNRSLMMRAFFAPSLEWFGFVFLCVLLVLVGTGFWRHFQGEDLLQLMVALGLLMKPVKELGEQLARYHETKGILKSSLDVFQKIKEGKGSMRHLPSVLSNLDADVKLSHITVGVGSKVLFSSHLSWGFKGGENIAILGPSGAGKTSLIRCLAGLVPPQEWKANYSWEEITSLCSLVSQDPFLFNDSLRKNLLYPQPRESSQAPDDSVLWEALEFVGLGDEVKGFKDQLDTPIAAFSHNVSGGQLQRLVIARALLRKRKILLLDEATSAIDSEAEKNLLIRLTSQVRRYSQVMIAITHRVQWLHLFDKIIFVEKGLITMVGTYGELYLEERFQAFCRSEADGL